MLEDLFDRWKVLRRSGHQTDFQRSLVDFTVFVIFCRSVRGLRISLMVHPAYGCQRLFWESGHRRKIFLFYEGLSMFYVTEFGGVARHSNFYSLDFSHLD